MNNIDSKELTKLVKQCRKLGIKTFKCDEFEFTLDNNVATPIRRNKRSKKPILSYIEDADAIPEDQEQIPSNDPTEEQLMFWSAVQDTKSEQ